MDANEYQQISMETYGISLRPGWVQFGPVWWRLFDAVHCRLSKAFAHSEPQIALTDFLCLSVLLLFGNGATPVGNWRVAAEA
jgi:hypothetical protein